MRVAIDDIDDIDVMGVVAAGDPAGGPAAFGALEAAPASAREVLLLLPVRKAT